MGTIHHIHERRARPAFRAVQLEEALPKTDSPAVIVLVCAGNVLLWVGTLVLMLTGGF